MNGLLPQELIEAIVGHIKGTTDLRNCALISHAWVRPSQARLFNSLSIPLARSIGLELPSHGSVSKSIAYRLEKFTEDSPHILDYFECLNLTLEHIVDNPVRLSSVNHVAGMLPLFGRLKVLKLISMGVWLEDAVSPPLMQSLSYVIKSPVRHLTIHTIVFRHLSEFVELLSDNPELDSLTLKFVVLCPSILETRADALRHPFSVSLQTFSVVYGRLFPALTTYFAYLGSVKVTHLSMAWTIEEDPKDLITTLEPSSLVSLELFPGEPPIRDNNLYFTLSTFTNLRKLSFPLHDPESFDLLSSLPRPQHIASLIIRIFTSSNTLFFEAAILQRLDTFLSSPHFSGLKDVIVPCSDVRIDPKAITKIANGFPLLLGRGILSIASSIYSSSRSDLRYQASEILSMKTTT